MSEQLIKRPPLENIVGETCDSDLVEWIRDYAVSVETELTSAKAELATLYGAYGYPGDLLHELQVKFAAKNERIAKLEAARDAAQQLAMNWQHKFVQTLVKPSVDQVVAEQAEIGKWQQAVYELICKECGIAVDGGGSDSDELDFTLSEIREGIAHLKNVHDEQLAAANQRADDAVVLGVALREYLWPFANKSYGPPEWVDRVMRVIAAWDKAIRQPKEGGDVGL